MIKTPLCFVKASVRFLVSFGFLVISPFAFALTATIDSGSVSSSGYSFTTPFGGMNGGYGFGALTLGSGSADPLSCSGDTLDMAVSPNIDVQSIAASFSTNADGLTIEFRRSGSVITTIGPNLGATTHTVNATNIDTIRFIDSCSGATSSSGGFDFQTVTFTAATVSSDSDGSLTSAGGVSEPVGLATTVDSSGEAVNVFDFTLSDAGTSDGSSMDISSISIPVSGSSTDADRAKVTWRLNGNDASNVTGSYDTINDEIDFTGLSISIANSGSEIYTVNAFYNDNTGLTEDTTFVLSVDGDTNVTVSSGTTMGSTSAVNNGSGTTADVTATALAFTTQPATSTSGSALATQPVVTARDAFGNTDVDFSETVTVTEASAGTLSGDVDIAAVSGVATFTDVVYSATADQQSFTLTANDEDGTGSNIPTVDASAVTSDVVATQLVFDTQPAPVTFEDDVATSLTTVPVVSARDADNIVDTGYSTDITLREINGAGTASISGTGDNDGNGGTVSITPVSGVATYTGLQVTYRNSGSTNENFNLQVNSGALTNGVSNQLTGTVADSDGDVTAAAGVTEPVAIATTSDTVGEAVDVFDFTISDGGSADGDPLSVSSITVNVSGTASDAIRNQITWRLNGADASNVAGTYNAGSNTITFSSLSISVADGGSEIYTINAHYNDNTSLTEDLTFILSIDGGSDLTVSGTGTQMGATSPVTNGSGSTVDVTATALVFTTQPASSTSGSALGTQPVVTARDAFGNTDVDFSETVTLTDASAGTLSGDVDIAAVSGVATFTDVVYSATADQQSFTLTANDEDGSGSNIPTADANAVTSDVVATQLVFDTQPVPLTVDNGVATSFTTVPVVSARDANSIVDTGYSTDITLSEINGAGSASLSGTGDTDGDGATVSLTPSSGVATYTALQITYSNSGGSDETFNLAATSGGLTTSASNQLTGTVFDTDGSLTAAGGVSEPVAINTSVDTSGEAVSVFDFTITDGGTADGDPLSVSAITVNVSGTASDAIRNQITWRLNGADASNVAGTYNAGSNTITFSSLSISVADGGSEIYTINAHYNDNTSVTEDLTFALSVDGDTDLTVSGTGTQMGATSPVTNGSGSTVEVTATALVFTTQPATSTSGSALATQPVVTARDAFGNTDVDFSETVTVTEASAGTLSGDVDIAAVSGVATFTDVVYSATADQQSFTLTANDEDGTGSNLSTVNANSVTSDVVATQLQFTTQPIPTSVNTGEATAFSTVPVVTAIDADSIVDTGYSTGITLAEVNGAGSATLSGTGDTDGSGATVTITPSSGVSTFTALNITYTASGASSENFNLQASSGGLSTVSSSALTGVVDSTPPAIPPAADLSSASDSGTSNSDNTTSDNTPTFTGSAEADSTVALLSSVSGAMGTTSADGSGNWSFTSSTLADGVHNITVTATDAASNTSSASTALAITIDTSAPATPLALDLSAASDSGSSNSDNNTSNTTPVLSGSAEANSSIVITSSLSGVVDNTSADGSGDWSITSPALSEDTHNLTFTATDLAGNQSAASAALALTVDATAPSTATGTLAVNENANNSTAVGTVVSTGASAFVLTDNATGRFAINASSGVVTVLDNSLLNYEDNTSHAITVETSDLAGNTTSTGMTVTVNNTNDAPTITGTPAISVNEDEAYSFIPVGDDSDSGDSLTYSIVNRPTWASFNTGSGELSGTPDNDQVGVTNGIVITVTDSASATASLASFNLTVVNANDDPVISGTPDTAVVEGVAYSFTPTGSDVDVGDTITYVITNQPTWAGFSTATGALTGTPAVTDVGSTTGIVIGIYDGTTTVNLAAFNLLVVNDLDNDGIGDDVDPDIDGDGMSNDFETANGLDPNDPSDAAGDLDGDGVNNLDEFLAGSDPALDDYAPVVTPPADITVDAVGLFTEVISDVATAIDGQDGEVQVSSDAPAYFSPGNRVVTWTAVDAAGNEGTATQTVSVNPLVSFSKDQQVAEGSTVTVKVILNGPAATYPVTVPYTVSGSAESGTDHLLVDGSVDIADPDTETSISFNVLEDAMLEGMETIVLTMGDPTNGVSAVKDQHLVEVHEDNVAPSVTLSAQQSAVDSLMVGISDGDVVVSVAIQDPNPTDTHTITWQADNALLDTDAVDSQFTFDASVLSPGLYQVAVVVSDGEAEAEAQLVLNVVTTLPSLSALEDSDGDGIDDLTEGAGDSDQDGIADYLDSVSAANTLQELPAQGNQFLIETNPGLGLSLGDLAFEANNGSAALNLADLESANVSTDDYYEYEGGLVDFVVNDLPVAGDSIDVVIPQQAAIPEDAVYRKLSATGWNDFVENGDNALSSAPGAEGFCPPPGDAAYEPGLVEGYWCVQLTIEDGGPNDDDGEANQTIVDPGGVGQLLATEVVVTASRSGGSGGSVGTLFLFMLSVLGAMKSRRLVARKFILFSACLSVSVVSTSANAWYLGAGMGMVYGGESESKFNQQLADTGEAVYATKFDTDRNGWRVFVGEEVHRNGSIELGYMDLGEADVQVEGTVIDANLDSFLNGLNEISPATGRGYTAHYLYRFYEYEAFSVQGKVGLFFWSSKYSVAFQGGGTSIQNEGTDLSLGLSVDYTLSERLKIQFNADRYEVDDSDINFFNLAVTGHFDRLF